MPGKGRRVAARQAELSRRKRRQGQSQTTSGANAPSAPAAVADRSEGAPTPQAGQPAAAAPLAAARSDRQRGPVRARQEQPMVYSYVGAELRRIFIVTGVVLAVLVALTFTFHQYLR